MEQIAGDELADKSLRERVGDNDNYKNLGERANTHQKRLNK